MHAHDERLFVVAAIEDADAPALRQTLGATPEKVVVQLFRRRCFERRDFATLRIDAGHHMLDSAVFTGSIHRLKDNQHGPAILRVEFVLKLLQQLDTRSQRLLCFRFFIGVEVERVGGVDLFQSKTLAVGDAKRFGIFFGVFDEVFHRSLLAGGMLDRIFRIGKISPVHPENLVNPVYSFSAISLRSSCNPRRIASNAGSRLISGIGAFPRTENQMMRFSTSGSAMSACARSCSSVSRIQYAAAASRAAGLTRLSNATVGSSAL